MSGTGAAGFGEIGERLRRSTVQVRVGPSGRQSGPGFRERGGPFAAQGSGLIVKPDGTIITNAHVAAATPIEVELWDASRLPANVLLRDAARDIAVLRLEPPAGTGILPSALPPLYGAPLSNSDRLRVGELVIAVGNPLGFTGALTTGIVHALGRVPGLGPMKWIQADVRLAPGNSGGPLANARGEVVGINTMIAGGIGLAVPSNAVARLLKGEPSGVPLGIVARPVEIALRGAAQLGMLILEIVKNSPAEAASLMLGDIIVGINEGPLDSMDDFERVLAGDSDRVVRLQFLRGDRTHVRTVAVRLGVHSMAAA